MSLSLLRLILIGAGWSEAQTSLKPSDLVCEYKTNPVGIDVERPRLSWKIRSQERGWVQSAYQLQVVTSAGELDSEPLWDSGKVVSDASIHRVYDGPSLRSSERYTWRVRVWNKENRASSWSDPAFWEMALLGASEWSAKWITCSSSLLIRTGTAGPRGSATNEQAGSTGASSSRDLTTDRRLRTQSSRDPAKRTATKLPYAASRHS